MRVFDHNFDTPADADVRTQQALIGLLIKLDLPSETLNKLRVELGEQLSSPPSPDDCPITTDIWVALYNFQSNY